MNLKDVEVNRRFFPDLDWSREHDNLPDAPRSPQCHEHITWAATVIHGIRGQITHYRYKRIRRFLSLKYTLYYFDKVTPATYIEYLLSHVD